MIRLELKRLSDPAAAIVDPVRSPLIYRLHVERDGAQVLLHVEGEREPVYEAAAALLRDVLGVAYQRSQHTEATRW